MNLCTGVRARTRGYKKHCNDALVAPALEAQHIEEIEYPRGTGFEHGDRDVELSAGISQLFGTGSLTAPLEHRRSGSRGRRSSDRQRLRGSGEVFATTRRPNRSSSRTTTLTGPIVSPPIRVSHDEGVGAKRRAGRLWRHDLVTVPAAVLAMPSRAARPQCGQVALYSTGAWRYSKTVVVGMRRPTC